MQACLDAAASRVRADDQPCRISLKAAFWGQGQCAPVPRALRDASREGEPVDSGSVEDRCFRTTVDAELVQLGGHHWPQSGTLGKVWVGQPSNFVTGRKHTMRMTCEQIATMSKQASQMARAIHDSPSGCAKLSRKLADAAFCLDIIQRMPDLANGTKACLVLIVRLDVMSRRLYTLIQLHHTAVMKLYTEMPPFQWREYVGPPMVVAYEYARSRLGACLADCIESDKFRGKTLRSFMERAHQSPYMPPQEVPPMLWLKWIKIRNGKAPALVSYATDEEADKLLDMLRRDEARLQEQLTFKGASFFSKTWASRVRQAAHTGRIRVQGEGRGVKYCVEDCVGLWGPVESPQR